MLNKVAVALLGVLIYMWYVRPEHRLVVTVSMTGDPSQMLDLDNVEDILEIERDLADVMDAGKAHQKNGLKVYY